MKRIIQIKDISECYFCLVKKNYKFSYNNYLLNFIWNKELYLLFYFNLIFQGFEFIDRNVMIKFQLKNNYYIFCLLLDINNMNSF